ncbi:SDR family NAD(P)-dependent oxidoreductase [Aestuariivivens insulae]|uniref:SDR family NAD(P)-dependent oxidoreductase n=1 Tax=Aestuariivivens insulae TaxID=1621988 RepID=UPI001F57A4FF|nr:SDR family oxidoreductase [Aestuariivivens insulae]
MDRLKNKVSIVTGAADGIGLAISQSFAKEGAIVVMADINNEKCSREAKKIVKEGHQAVALACDVGKMNSVNQTVDYCLDKYGRVDVLVNNAAVSISGNIMEMSEEDWDYLMNINLKGVFRCIKACLPSMISNRNGSVINIASGQAHRSWNDWTAYATAKGGMISMTTQLAGQFGDMNIRFNTISPGAILTPMAEERIKTEGEDYVKGSEFQASMLRFGEPIEVALTAVFLASDESSFITGDDLKVDGGLTSLPRYM